MTKKMKDETDKLHGNAEYGKMDADATKKAADEFLKGLLAAMNVAMARPEDPEVTLDNSAAIVKALTDISHCPICALKAASHAASAIAFYIVEHYKAAKMDEEAIEMVVEHIHKAANLVRDPEEIIVHGEILARAGIANFRKKGEADPKNGITIEVPKKPAETPAPDPVPAV